MDPVLGPPTRPARHQDSQRLRCLVILGIILLSGMHPQAYAQSSDRVFEAGDRVVVLLGPLRVREGAGLAFATKGNQQEGAIGTILASEPRSADGYTWWPVQWDDAMSGWSADGTSQDAFIGPVPTADAEVAEETRSPSSDRGTATDAQSAQPLGATGFEDFAGTWAGYYAQSRSDDPEPYSVRYVHALAFTLHADADGSGASGTTQLRDYDSPPATWHFASLQGAVLAGGDEYGPRNLTLAPTSHLTPSLEAYRTDRVIHYERTHTDEGVTTRIEGVFFPQSSADAVDWYEVDALMVDHWRHLDEVAEVARAGYRHERIVEESQWIADTGTGCNVLAYRDHVDSDAYREDVASIRWTGDCRFGLAQGAGDLELLDADGVMIARWSYGGTSGATFVDGIPTANIDSVRTRFFLDSCSKRTARDLWGKILIYVRNDAGLDLANPVVTAALRDAAIPFFVATCWDRYPPRQVDGVGVRLSFSLTDDADPSDREGDWTNRSTGSIAAPSLDQLVVLPETIREQVRTMDSNDYAHDRMSAFRQAYSARLDRLRADARQAAQAVFDASPSGVVSRERANLESNYADLAFFVRDARIGIAATVPAQFPTPEFTAAGTFECDEGRVTSDEPVLFERFVDLTDARVDEHGFYFRDVSATCDGEGQVTIASGDFHRTLALIDSLQQASAFDFLLFYPRPSSDARYLGIGFDAAGWLTLNNPSGYTPGPYSINLWESHRVTASTNFAAVALRGEGGLQPVWFDGQASSPSFDVRRSFDVIFQLRADDPLWSYLSIDMSRGSLTYWRSTTAPR